MIWTGVAEMRPCARVKDVRTGRTSRRKFSELAGAQRPTALLGVALGCGPSGGEAKDAGRQIFGTLLFQFETAERALNASSPELQNVNKNARNTATTALNRAKTAKLETM